MSDVVFGRDMIMEAKVSGEYLPVACADSCSFTFQNELIAKTDVNAGLFRKRRVRISDCSMSVSSLLVLENSTKVSPLYFLQEAVRRIEQDLRITFTDEAGVQKQIQGIFLLESGQISGEVSGFSESDLEFQGTGGFTISDVVDDSGSGGIPGDVDWDWWEGVEGENTITGTGYYGRSFAGKDIIEVDREGLQYDEVVGTPADGERQYSQDGTTITFPTGNPFEAGTRVFVIWQN